MDIKNGLLKKSGTGPLSGNEMETEDMKVVDGTRHGSPTSRPEGSEIHHPSLHPSPVDQHRHNANGIFENQQQQMRDTSQASTTSLCDDVEHRVVSPEELGEVENQAHSDETPLLNANNDLRTSHSSSSSMSSIGPLLTNVRQSFRRVSELASLDLDETRDIMMRRVSSHRRRLMCATTTDNSRSSNNSIGAALEIQSGDGGSIPWIAGRNVEQERRRGRRTSRGGRTNGIRSEGAEGVGGRRQRRRRQKKKMNTCGQEEEEYKRRGGVRGRGGREDNAHSIRNGNALEERFVGNRGLQNGHLDIAMDIGNYDSKHYNDERTRGLPSGGAEELMESVDDGEDGTGGMASSHPSRNRRCPMWLRRIGSLVCLAIEFALGVDTQWFFLFALGVVGALLAWAVDEASVLVNRAQTAAATAAEAAGGGIAGFFIGFLVYAAFLISGTSLAAHITQRYAPGIHAPGTQSRRVPLSLLISTCRLVLSPSARSEPDPAALPPVLINDVVQGAAGSGIPEMRSFIAGYFVPGFLELRTMYVKIAGLILSMGTGLNVGNEGPFVSICSVVAERLLALRSFRRLKESRLLHVDLLAAACAVGVSSTFGAPIGGVLFSIEVTASVYRTSSYWKVSQCNHLLRCLFSFPFTEPFPCFCSFLPCLFLFPSSFILPRIVLCCRRTLKRT